MTLFLTAVGLTAFSGAPGLLFSPRSLRGQWFSVIVTLAGALLGISAALRALFHGAVEAQWGSPPVFKEGLSLLLDPLSAVFLLSIFLIPALGAVYGLGYWKQTEHPSSGRKLRFFYGWVTAGMALVVTAHGAFLFLISWEIMALSAFFLVATEDEKKESQEAAWVYFVATHVSTLLLFGMFGLLAHLEGSFGLYPLAEGTFRQQDADLLFLLALVAFSLKAGLFPFHVWLPAAHANAPTHVSALLSGVLLKVGVYGLLRVCWLIPHPPVWWGTVVVVMGVLSSILGVVFAIGQHDLKRLLAYHSVENIGIIFLGMGLALLGRSYGRPEWTLLGLAGALLHVWNHGLFKALLFLSAGSVIHSTHTRELDGMGGLGKRMPKTALAFLVGAVAICGLPPLNGFISELFIFVGLFKTFLFTGGVKNGSLLLAAPALALTGGLALACFTKAYGAVFLGESRQAVLRETKENGGAMLFPMLVMGVLCFGIGLVPGAVSPLLESAAASWEPLLANSSLSLSGIIPLTLFPLSGGFLLFFFFVGLWLVVSRKSQAPSNLPTWDCGYAKPSPSMQYSASSFAQMLIQFYKWVLLPEGKEVRLEGFFPGKASFHTHVPETVLEKLIFPVVTAGQWLIGWVRWVQLGYPQAYILYIVLTLMILIFLN